MSWSSRGDMVPLSKVGMGYDIHRLVKGRKLVLGGVEIPFEKGLDGHSDADVVLHAICDALLGAIGKGDIGEHFPNSDEKYRNISSLLLLARVKELVHQAGYRVNNIDTMILAEEPNLTAYKQAMRLNIATVLRLESQHINIKATTQEGLGFGSGAQEAVAAYAVALLTKEGI